MSKFGWSLPPGCSMNDIDQAFGDQPTYLEVFEGQKGKELNPDDRKLLDHLFELDCDNDLLDRILGWAYGLGYDACQCDEAEYQHYRYATRQIRLPKIRAYFKNLRQRETADEEFMNQLFLAREQAFNNK